MPEIMRTKISTGQDLPFLEAEETTGKNIYNRSE
jgi:hypothetical protein